MVKMIKYYMKNARYVVTLTNGKYLTQGRSTSARGECGSDYPFYPPRPYTSTTIHHNKMNDHSR